jgi:hypothetical protein
MLRRPWNLCAARRPKWASFVQSHPPAMPASQQEFVVELPKSPCGGGSGRGPSSAGRLLSKSLNLRAVEELGAGQVRIPLRPESV